MRRVAVAVLLVLAGCGGTIPSGAEGPTTTVTPAPVPEAAPTSDALAPGLASGGVFDAGRLTAAHAEALAGRSFTRVRTDTRLANGTVLRRDETVLEYAASGREFHYRLDQTDRRGDRIDRTAIERYADGERVYVAATRGNRTGYSILEGPDGEAYDPARVFPQNATGESPLARLFVLVSVRVTDRETVDGETVYRVETPGPQDIPPLEGIRLVANVTEAGLVRDYRVSYDVDRGGRPVRVVATVEYRAIGETVVDPPTWLPEAKRAVEEGGSNATGTA